MGARILIVDDEESIRLSVSDVLADEGYEPIVAVDGAEALQGLEKDLPDLVLLDVAMPGRDGIVVLEELRRAWPDLPVVMMSGHGTIETAVRATKLGAYDFLEKPLSYDKLLLCIRHVLESVRLSRENEALRDELRQARQIIGDSPVMQKLKEQIVELHAHLQENGVDIVAKDDRPPGLIEINGDGAEPTAARKPPQIDLTVEPVPPRLVNAASLRTALANLAANALDVLATGGGTFAISLRARERRAYIVVEDDGPGIPEGDQERVFDPFFTTKGMGEEMDSPHLGMGLAVAHGIIRELGGSMRLESRAGRGTRFEIALPIEPDQDQNSPNPFPTE